MKKKLMGIFVCMLIASIIPISDAVGNYEKLEEFTLPYDNEEDDNGITAWVHTNTGDMEGLAQQDTQMVKMTDIILDAIEDSYIYQKMPTSNYGAETEFVLFDMPYYECRSLINFDLSPIPDEAQISAAILYIYYKGEAGTPDPTKIIDIHRNTQAWNESTVTWNNKPAYCIEPSNSIPLGTEGEWRSFDIKEDIQDIVDEIVSNYGWTIKFHTLATVESEPVFDSKESMQHHPYLFVTYLTLDEIRIYGYRPDLTINKIWFEPSVQSYTFSISGNTIVNYNYSSIGGCGPIGRSPRFPRNGGCSRYTS